ncbi:MAG: MarR family winged helix-turn-helix transcriptional regulator [Clostridia bacterium]|jgi:DNA-binding MarR family transcriptional regulator
MRDLRLECHSLLMKVGWKVIRKTRKNLNKMGFGWHQFLTMRSIQPGESVTLSEISNRISKKSSNVTTLINFLEEKGIVRRIADRKDRRVVRIELTENGEKIRERAIAEHEDFIEQLYMELSQANMEDFIGVMTMMDKKIQA